MPELLILFTITFYNYKKFTNHMYPSQSHLPTLTSERSPYVKKLIKPSIDLREVIHTHNTGNHRPRNLTTYLAALSGMGDLAEVGISFFFISNIG